MESSGSSFPDRVAERIEERPAKRLCLASPGELSTELDREIPASVGGTSHHDTEMDEQPDQQGTQAQNAVGDQLFTIPGLGNLVDQEETTKPASVEDALIVNEQTTSNTESIDPSRVATLPPSFEPSDPLQAQTPGVIPVEGKQTENSTNGHSIINSETSAVMSDNFLISETDVDHPEVSSGSGTNLPSTTLEAGNNPAPGMEQDHNTAGYRESALSHPIPENQESNSQSVDETNIQAENSKDPLSRDAKPPNVPAHASVTVANSELEPPKTPHQLRNGEDPNQVERQSDTVPVNGNGSTVIPDVENSEIPSAQGDGPNMANINTHLDAIEASINNEGAEWEIDSSPYESSSDSDSSSSGSDSDDESDDDNDETGADDYALLAPEEQARVLMRDEGGSDDEGGGKKDGRSGAAQLRTLNEQPEEIVPKPDIIVTPEMKIEELGKVECIVEDTVVVKAKTSGEYQVLEAGSLLCLENRSVVGVVAETIGRVQQPMYTIRFTNKNAIDEAGLSAAGTSVCYVEEHSSFIFTYPMRSVKGTDASNFHDEEVGEDEMEFSDDEKEAEHKRQLKLQRQAKKGNRLDTKDSRRGSKRPNNPRSGNAWDTPPAGVGEISYDDMETANDGYTPLQRPDNYQEMLNGVPAISEDLPISRSSPPRDQYSNRGRNRGGRGERGERGGRGRGEGRGAGKGAQRKGNFLPRQHLGSSNMGPPPLSSYNGRHPYGPPPHWQHSPSQSYFPPSYPLPPNGAQMPSAPALTPQSPAMPFSPSPISPLPTQSFGFQNVNPYPQQQPQLQSPQMPPPGSYINPAFFNNMPQPNQGIPPSTHYGHSNGSGNAEAYKQVNELLASLNSHNRQGVPR